MSGSCGGKVNPGCPRRGTPFSHGFARRVLALFGWRVEGSLPDEPRFVVIVAPHTSNLDFFICIMAMFAVGLRISWLGKHTIFFWPAKYILRWLGGEAVDRSTPAGIVEAAIKRFKEASQWALGVSPEGTRKLTTEWKTGFYRIATGAGVPIVPVALDYHRRALAIGAPMWPTGDPDADISRLRASFHRGMALRPANFFEPDPDTPASHQR